MGMTVQEAISSLRYRINTAKDIVGAGESGNSFEDMEMGIKALENIETLKEQLAELAVQEDAPVYEGDREVDSYIKLNDAIDLINKLAEDNNYGKL